MFLTAIITYFFQPTFASGGFGGGSVAGQALRGKEREKFNLGKAIYNGEVALDAKRDELTKTQKNRLEYLQGSLPNAEKGRVSLEDLAGKLSEEQISALEFFVSIRFNVKLEEKKE
ncbi:hypothetical protein EHQ53_10765 [Leptospira langatensis]|uniref:Uncharacterized protein n=1 Tax=Leptospira langatensis TaxID=2484983 RepID=A0A5F1ZUU8_9LEPT|nr:hypothetical protein [Leptospira langatensis]TGJ99052.1 hypothetical protein EHO57_15735 [Leptospira langatensis]TGL40759.1 hypothetical protein EHQ53_10765 [Leptospira langatensis]